MKIEWSGTICAGQTDIVTPWAHVGAKNVWSYFLNPECSFMPPPRSPRVDVWHGLGVRSVSPRWRADDFPVIHSPNTSSGVWPIRGQHCEYWPMRGQYCKYWPIRGQHDDDSGEEGVLFPPGHVWHPEHASCGHETLTRHMVCLWSGSNEISRYPIYLSSLCLHWFNEFLDSF